MPATAVNGGGPAGGGVPGGVSRNVFGVLHASCPGSSLKRISSCTCVPWFETSTTPLPVKPAGSVNEKSPRMIVDVGDRRDVDRRRASGATCDLADHARARRAACRRSPGMKHATA